MSSVESYILECPPQANWKIRAMLKCNSTMKYFCLFNNVHGKYVEGCEGPDWDRKGSKRIFSVSFTRGKCKQKRFQPFTFRTNECMSDCIYAKSLCNEEGQLLYREDSTRDDRTCRCDYTKNYSYTKAPRNICFCIPTEEDCSCYIKHCPVNQTLSTDYECTSHRYQEKPKCKEIRYFKPIDENTRVYMEEDHQCLSDTSTEPTRIYTTVPNILISLCTIIIFVIGIARILLVEGLLKCEKLPTEKEESVDEVVRTDSDHYESTTDVTAENNDSVTLKEKGELATVEVHQSGQRYQMPCLKVTCFSWLKQNI